MGLFDILLGSTSSKYSQDEHQLSREEIRKLVSHAKIRSLSGKEEIIIEEAIDKRRHGNGKISLRQIYESLRSLENKHVISEFDRKWVVKVFEEYFNK